MKGQTIEITQANIRKLEEETAFEMCKWIEEGYPGELVDFLKRPESTLPAHKYLYGSIENVKYEFKKGLKL